MWILSFFPEPIIHAILILGILGTLAGTILGFVPFIKTYRLPIQVLSILVLIFGVYLEGGLADYKEWQLKIKDMEVEMAKLKAKSAEKNIEIQEKIVEKTKVIREKGKDIIKYVDRDVIQKEEIIKYIENCPVPQEIIDIHNQAATMQGEKK